jgi:hypothetical protein
VAFSRSVYYLLVAAHCGGDAVQAPHRKMVNHGADCGHILHALYEPHIWVALVLVFQRDVRTVAGILLYTAIEYKITI